MYWILFEEKISFFLNYRQTRPESFLFIQYKSVDTSDEKWERDWAADTVHKPQNDICL